ncbi:undecaprenyl-diphosphate phosphatase [Paenibacillus thalictri]|uniref:Undecaprenyl-diphosphatase n=1 Tax=Paenibacillus thalictri TaxID=2527873 RepID=A0A4V2J3Q8_9BACL|nr:undecaprenyl-diphosphate phosphatase [Paenibacillus thalictri]TBL75089.1 undecaprenyl-diphosphate phosphatase [Paenibacillus thalictri]
MYSLWVSFIIGIVEGLTEFLPVSSTGHMILAQALLHIPEEDEMMKSFEVVIQLGAILAVVLLYWRRIMRLFGLSDDVKGKSKGQRLNLIHILIAIVPALFLAFIGRHFIKDYLFSPTTVLIGLILGGVFLIIAEKQQPAITATDMDQLTYKQSLFIGIAQCLSLWPGFSRAGATIAGGMLAGATRGAAANFTFLIAIPVMFAATGYEMLTSYKVILSGSFLFFGVGFIVSFIVALLAVVTFIKLVSKLSLTYFAYYRFVVAILFAIWMAVSK